MFRASILHQCDWIASRSLCRAPSPPYCRFCRCRCRKNEIALELINTFTSESWASLGSFSASRKRVIFLKKCLVSTIFSRRTLEILHFSLFKFQGPWNLKQYPFQYHWSYRLFLSTFLEHGQCQGNLFTPGSLLSNANQITGQKKAYLLPGICCLFSESVYIDIITFRTDIFMTSPLKENKRCKTKIGNLNNKTAYVNFCKLANR